MKKKTKFKRKVALSILLIGSICLGVWFYFQVPESSAVLTFNNIKAKGKILIVTTDCTGAHMSAAKAIRDNLKEISHDFYLVNEKTYLKIWESVMIYSWIRVLYNVFAPILWAVNSIFFVINGDGLKDLVLKNKYDCVISVMPWHNKKIHKQLKEIKTSFLVIPTDLEDPLITYNVLGFGTYWLDPTHDDIMYLLGSEKLIEQAKHLGITNVKPVSGMIINKKFTELKNSKAQLRQELGIPLDTKVVLFLFGSCASMEMVELFKIMQKHPEYYCVFICGKAVNIKSKLEELDKDKKCKILGFVNNVEEWMKLSDVCVGKPGPGVISECMASGIPIVIKDGIDVMLQEKYNVEYIKEKGVGETLKNWKELPKLLQSILQNYDKYTQTFAALPKNNALDEVCEVVREVVGD